MIYPVAYTDGACLGNPGPGGWGVRIFSAGGAVQELGGAEPATTNNRMELQGAIAALNIMRTSKKATVITDSRYVIDGLTRWMPGWRRRGWITTSNTPVKNQELWRMLDQLHHAGIQWQHVYGHTGNPNNERVDAIARAFAKGTPPVLFCGLAGSPDDPVQSAPFQDLPATPPVPGALPQGSAGATPPARYVSIVRGVVAIDPDWAACAARVQGVSGARYKKVRTAEELAAFCAEHGVTLT